MPRRGQNYKITHNGRLKFTQVKVIDRGKYHCKVENEYKERVLSRVANLVVHAPAEVIDKHQLTRPRHVRVGAYARLSCQAAGIPPPRIEWRKNGELLRTFDKNNPVEKKVEKDTSPVSLTSVLMVKVTQSAAYTCSAINKPIEGRVNDSVVINVTAVPLPVTQTPQARANPIRQECAAYNGSVCRPYLQGRMVLHNRTQGYGPEDMLESHLAEMTALELFAPRENGASQGFCEGPAHRLLCHLVFPDCRDDSSPPLQVCR
ncbi:muscle, skeletal receptor tyrosine-protein kinase [Aplysia californica]|uniref:Muscle, skeletal receptor tyrosine-protein kinase n=1 Tax=Aplysia californica TaxID=6500 RepID=A0ABM1A3L5_APLCA|nr:muscle, skeletal receptor tyrosine-protein kinase [Aplysia californica]